MSGFFHVFLIVYAAIFPIVNPLGNAPLFLEMTRHCSPKVRHALAWQVAVSGFLLLLASFFLGSPILGFFGVTLPVVRLGGGLVVATFGWRMLNRKDAEPSSRSLADAGAAQQAFYPLTMPLTVGPGSIATAIAVGSQKPIAAANWRYFLLDMGGAVAGLAAIALTIYLSYRFADRIEQILGRSGTNVLVRLFAFLLLCIGVQIMWAGLSELIVQAKAL